MRKGILAEWRRGIVARGAAAALLLAVPVGVAAAIGFEGSLGGLGEGLTALASGPDSSQAAEPGDGGADPIGDAISALVSPTGPGSDSGQGPPGAGGGTGTGTGTGGESPGGDGGSGGSPGGTGGPTGGGEGDVNPPEITAPNGNPVGELVDGLGDSVGGLLGG